MKLALTVVLALAATPSFATSSWDDIRNDLYGERVLIPAEDVIAIDAPYRAADDTRTMIGADIQAPGGRRIAEVTVVLDENPQTEISYDSYYLLPISTKQYLDAQTTLQQTVQNNYFKT